MASREAGRKLPDLELVGGGDGLAVEKETVERDALGGATHAAEGEPRFHRPGCHDSRFGQRGQGRHARDDDEHTEEAKPSSHSYLSRRHQSSILCACRSDDKRAWGGGIARGRKTGASPMAER